VPISARHLTAARFFAKHAITHKIGIKPKKCMTSRQTDGNLKKERKKKDLIWR
jgi:hypothetical protein